MRPVRKIGSERSHSFQVLDRHEWVQTSSNSDGYEIFFMKTRNLSRSTIDKVKYKKNNAGNKNSEYGLQYLQEHGFSFIPVSCKHFRTSSLCSGLNSCQSHVLSSLCLWLRRSLCRRLDFIPLFWLLFCPYAYAHVWSRLKSAVATNCYCPEKQSSPKHSRLI